MTLEIEVPEVLFEEMKNFVSSHPKSNRYSFLTTALTHFLFQNGCEDRNVKEIYLNDLFRTSPSFSFEERES